MATSTAVTSLLFKGMMMLMHPAAHKEKNELAPIDPLLAAEFAESNVR